MTPVERARAAIQQSGIPVESATVTRGRELRAVVPPGAIVSLAGYACGDLGCQLVSMVAEDRLLQQGGFVVHYVFAHARDNWMLDGSVETSRDEPELVSLAPYNVPASRFEREIADLFGIAFKGHPAPRRLARHGFWPEDYYPLRKDAAVPRFTDDGQPFPFVPVGGEGVYEIPVGPVHAGVIEPGHFRFSVLGETIIDMKSRLYFTHKGTEKLFEARLPEDGVELAERISGDTTVGHALAYCEAIERASNIEVPARAQYLRVILLELERLYNHVADFGAIANDTGFAVAHAHCFRVREGLLRLNKRLTGSRLLRGAVIPGGVQCDLDPAWDLSADVRALVGDFDEIADIALSNTLLSDRLEGTGVLSRGQAEEHGVLGYVARASGIDADARRDHPCAAYGSLSFNVPVLFTGDVDARARIRLSEIHESSGLIAQACRSLPRGPLAVPLAPIAPGASAIGIIEGWRGRIVHWVMTGADGRLHRVKVVDPSFLNWPALSLALADNIVPDFPLCNKSFNQSYSGNDL
jgi:Ni,Fe-hydrogenase III large subunit/Ni,Fe-hydrogenase III component G